MAAQSEDKCKKQREAVMVAVHTATTLQSQSFATADVEHTI